MHTTFSRGIMRNQPSSNERRISNSSVVPFPRRSRSCEKDKAHYRNLKEICLKFLQQGCVWLARSILQAAWKDSGSLFTFFSILFHFIHWKKKKWEWKEWGLIALPCEASEWSKEFQFGGLATKNAESAH